MESQDRSQSPKADRSYLYYKAYLPHLVVASVIVLMIAVSSEHILQTETAPIRSFSVLCCLFVLGRLADLFTTLVGVGMGATELNPGLPENPSLAILLPRVLGQIFFIPIGSFLCISLLFSITPVISASEPIHRIVTYLISSAYTRDLPMILYASGGLVLVMTMASFAAGLSNIVALAFPHYEHEESLEGKTNWIVMFIAPLLVALAVLLLSNKSKSAWEIMGFYWFFGFNSIGLAEYFSRDWEYSRIATRSFLCSSVIAVLTTAAWRVVFL